MGNYDFSIKHQLAPNSDPKYKEITLGSQVCRTIKKAFYPEIRWNECCIAVSQKFTILKQLFRKVYQEKDDEHILELLRFCSAEDFKESIQG